MLYRPKSDAMRSAGWACGAGKGRSCRPVRVFRFVAGRDCGYDAGILSPASPPRPSAGGRIGRRGRVGRKTIKKLSDKSQTASFVRRLFGIVAEQAILGGWATSSDSFVRGRAAGMRVPPPSPATPVRLPFRSRRPVWLGRRPAGRRPHRAGAASDRPCRSGHLSRTSA